MMRVKPGDRVHVAFDATVESGCINVQEADSERGVAVYRLTSDDGCTHYVYLDSGICRPADPRNWPPLPGDIWEADGAEYFARGDLLRPGQVVVLGDNGSGFGGGEVDTLFRSMNPRLVRRR